MSDRIYKESLSLGLVITLTKFGEAVYRKGENDIHMLHDLDLSDLSVDERDSIHGNYSKLRFFGLIAKIKEGDKHIAGHWLLTDRGTFFLRNKLPTHKWVKTLDNRIVERSLEMVFIKQIWTEYSSEKWQQFFPWERDESGQEAPKQFTFAGIG